MTRARIVQEETTSGGKTFFALHFEMGNADLLFLSEEEDQLGTLAIAVPQKLGKLGPAISSILMGERNVLLARLFAERLAEKTKKITLVSVFNKTTDETEASKIFLRLIDRIVKRRIDP